MINANVSAPTIGSRGIYTLLPPYNTLTTPGEEYTCQGLRLLTDMVSDGLDPMTTVYVSHALTKVEYDLALTNGVYIVSLQGSSGQHILVPANYISGQPVTDGIKYAVKIIGLSLGPLAIDRDLSNLSTTLSNIVHDQLGVVPEVRVVQVSKVTLVPPADHVIIEGARVVLTTATPSDRVVAIKSKTTLDQALIKIQQLEAYIIANRLKLGI